jgi:hypothetical protein
VKKMGSFIPLLSFLPTLIFISFVGFFIWIRFLKKLMVLFLWLFTT